MSGVYSAIADLEWFFSSSQSQLGLCSNFAAIRNALLNGGVSKTSKPDNINEIRMDSARRYREVHEKLQQLPTRLRDYIYAAYHPRDFGPELWAAFGRSTGVTPFTKAGCDEFEKDAAKKHDDQAFFIWLRGCVARQETSRIEKIRRESQRYLDDAHRAYAALGV